MLIRTVRYSRNILRRRIELILVDVIPNYPRVPCVSQVFLGVASRQYETYKVANCFSFLAIKPLIRQRVNVNDGVGKCDEKKEKKSKVNVK